MTQKLATSLQQPPGPAHTQVHRHRNQARRAAKSRWSLSGTPGAQNTAVPWAAAPHSHSHIAGVASHTLDCTAPRDVPYTSQTPVAVQGRTRRAHELTTSHYFPRIKALSSTPYKMTNKFRPANKLHTMNLPAVASSSGPVQRVACLLPPHSGLCAEGLRQRSAPQPLC